MDYEEDYSWVRPTVFVLADEFESLIEALPQNYRLLIQGPNLDGSWTVGVISKLTVARQVASGKGPLAEALWIAGRELESHLERMRVANI